jgi:hypothetical protein
MGSRRPAPGASSNLSGTGVILSGFFPLMPGDSRVISRFFARIWTPADKLRQRAPQARGGGLWKNRKIERTN